MTTILETFSSKALSKGTAAKTPPSTYPFPSISIGLEKGGRDAEEANPSMKYGLFFEK